MVLGSLPADHTRTFMCWAGIELCGLKVAASTLSPMAAKKKSPTIDSLRRGIDLLEILAERESVKLADLPDLLQTSRATAFRVLKTLQERGYVEHIESQSAYRLGAAAMVLASRSEQSSVVRVSEPALRDLAERTGETVNLALFRTGRLVYVEIVEGRHALRMSGSISQDVPVHSTALGKAMLAALPNDSRRALLGPEPWMSYTSNTKTNWNQLGPDIQLTAKRGYALDREEMDYGAVCIGAAIMRAEGHPVGGISVSGWSQRLSGRKQSEIGRTLSDWCTRISGELGFAGNGSGVAARGS